MCDSACSNVWGSEGSQVSAYLFGFFGNCLAPFQGPSTSTVAVGILVSRAPQRRKAHPSSKHSNLTTTKSSAKINSHQTGGKNVLLRATLLFAQRSLGWVYLGLCFLHGKTTRVVGLCKAENGRRNSKRGGRNLLPPRVYL